MNTGISTYFPLWTPHGTLLRRLQKFLFLSLLQPSGSKTWQAKRTSSVKGSIVLSSTTTHLVIPYVCQVCRSNRTRGMSRIVCTVWALKLASLIGQVDGFFNLLRSELSLLPTVTICHQVNYRTCQFIPHLCNMLIHIPLCLLGKMLLAPPNDRDAFTVKVTTSKKYKHRPLKPPGNIYLSN